MGEGYGPDLKKILIPQSVVEEARCFLDTVGYDSFRLFQDLDTLAVKVKTDIGSSRRRQEKEKRERHDNERSGENE
jgi:hypothetical protein